MITELIGYDKMSAGLLTADHKVIYNFIADAMRIYDLRADPAERNDLLLGDRAALAPVLAVIDGYRDTRKALRRYSIDAKRKSLTQEDRAKRAHAGSRQ